MAGDDAGVDGAGNVPRLDLAAAGETALRRLAVQVALLYLAGPVLMTLLLVTRNRWISTVVLVGVLVACAVSLVRGMGTLSSPATQRGLVALSIAAGFLMPWVNLARAPEPVLAGQAWVLTAVPGALAVASGVIAASTAYLATAGASVLGATLVGGAVRLMDFGAPLVSLSVCLILGALLRRGYRRAVAVAADLDVALAHERVAHARWQAQHRTNRLMHDTVLAALTILCQHGGTLTEREREVVREALAALAPEEVTAAVTGVGPVVGCGSGVAQGRVVTSPESNALVEELDRIAERTGLRVDLVPAGEVPDLAPGTRAAMLAATQEGLRNVLRHAGTGTAQVLVCGSTEGVEVLVIDTGRGFDPAHGMGFGLRSSVLARMREVGGNADVWSTPGRGTTVRLMVPARMDAAR
jgi:signal transduction histidine kinase